MSKIKDHLQFQEDVKLEYYGKFMDHIYDVLHPEPRLSEEDIEKMEKSYGNSSNPINLSDCASVPTQPINSTETTRRSA